MGDKMKTIIETTMVFICVAIILWFFSGCATLNPVEQAMKGKSNIIVSADKVTQWEKNGFDCHYIGKKVVEGKEYACQK